MSLSELKIDPKRLQERIRNDFEEAERRRSTQKQPKSPPKQPKRPQTVVCSRIPASNSAQESSFFKDSGEQARPKRVRRGIWKPSVVDPEAPKSPQKPPKGAQESHKAVQDHLRIENIDFPEIDECLNEK